MEKKLPSKPREHDLEEISKRFFINSLPHDWLAEKPSGDYGVDLVVNIFEDGHTTPYELHVQLKASDNTTDGDDEKVNLRVATYNHLMGALPVTMLVKYVHADKEAYWMLVVDIDTPNQKQETFTVNIPKTNKLSLLDWKNTIGAYIKDVVDYKLASAEEKRQNRKKGK